MRSSGRRCADQRARAHKAHGIPPHPSTEFALVQREFFETEIPLIVSVLVEHVRCRGGETDQSGQRSSAD